MQLRKRKNVSAVVFVSLLFLSIFVSPLAFVAASEEENIDSFDVHPASGRWTITDTGYTTTIEGINLKLSDTGDNTIDRYSITRKLRDLDGKIEIRFKVTASTSTSDPDNSFDIFLSGSGATSGIYFAIYNIRSGGVSDSRLRYYLTNGTLRELSLEDEDSISCDLWYILRIDYHVLKSTLKMQLYEDDGDRLFNYNVYDVTLGDLALFSQSTLQLRLTSGCKTSAMVRADYIDYIKAPFKEQEWRQIDTPSDSDWLADKWDGAYIQDDIDDTSTWRINIPYLDAVSGTMLLDYEGTTVVGDYWEIYFRIYGVEATNGTLRELIELYFQKIDDDNVMYDKSTGFHCLIGSTTFIISELINSNEKPAYYFTFTTSQSRSRLEVKGRVDIDVETSGSDTYDFVGVAEVTDFVVDPSQEFVLEIEYIGHFTGNIEAKLVIQDFDFIERGIFEDIFGGIFEGIAAIFTWIGGLFIGIFRWLGDVFKVVGDAITSAITALQTALGIAIGAVQTAVEAVTTAIGNLIDDIGALIEDIGQLATWIIEQLIALIGDIIDAGLAWLVTVISDLSDLLVGLFFFLWDAVGFPDLLAIINALLASFIDFITALPRGLADLAKHLQNIWDFGVILGVFIFLILPLLLGRTIGEFFEKMVEYMFTDATMGITIFGIGGRLPLVLVWLVMLALNILVGTDFAGFLTW